MKPLAPIRKTPTLDLSFVEQCVAEIGRTQEDLIPILSAIQKHYRYLPPEVMERLCDITDIRPADVAGVSTFYKQFRHRPAGAHTMRVCVGTACHVSGAHHVHQTCHNELGIQSGDDTSDDRQFTVEKVACFGCCMLAPVVRIDDITYGHVEPQRVPAVLKDFSASVSSVVEKTRRRTVPVGIGEVRTCMCSSCIAAGADTVNAELHRQIEALRLPVHVKYVGCLGEAFSAPTVDVQSEHATHRYVCVSAEEVRDILQRHFHPATPFQRLAWVFKTGLERLYLNAPATPVSRYSLNYRGGERSPFVDAQVRLATERAGELDPLDLEGYRECGGFVALARALDTLSPQQVIQEITSSGLRGRGGAGFCTGTKWALAAAAQAETRYAVCNGDEGDPGAFMDRMILESFPYRVLEGLALLAFAIGATEGILYIRAEYPLAAGRIGEAILRCEQAGVLGANALGSAHTFQLRVVEGAGAFVCGEETALLSALEGKRGMPHARPPYPVEKGFRGQPTVINNVETLALVPWIMQHGAPAFRAYGTDRSPGTKTFALAGKINRGGLIEVPMGTSLRRIIEDIGGGVPGGKRLKAVQIGGPSGGCIPAQLADTPVDYESLLEVGAIMGSGGLIVLDEDDCMVDVARYFLSFTQAESCGKCVPCRVGTRRMLEILTRLCQGDAQAEDLETLERLSKTVCEGSLCGLGKTAPNPVLSNLRYFRDEFEAHLRGECPARKCSALIQYLVTEDCIGCTICAQRCPVEAIAMTPYVKHDIDTDMCIRCDTCRQVCPQNAIVIEPNV